MMHRTLFKTVASLSFEVLTKSLLCVTCHFSSFRGTVEVKYAHIIIPFVATKE